jgi:hypothetical protein
MYIRNIKGRKKERKMNTRGNMSKWEGKRKEWKGQQKKVE